MGRKRGSHANRNGEENTAPDYTSRGATSIKAIKTWDDIEHNSEDEFHEQREKVLLGSDQVEQSDDEVDGEEEVFRLDGDDSDEEEEEEEESGSDSDDDDGQKENAEKDDDNAWGHSKKAYYDADEVYSDVDEAKEEEVEAMRLQKRRIATMREEDFLQDEDDSLEFMDVTKTGLGDQGAHSDRALVEGVTRDLDELGEDFGAERLQRPSLANLPRKKLLEMLAAESPEVIDLLAEFRERIKTALEELAPVLKRAKDLNMEPSPMLDFVEIKYHALLTYLTNIAFYFHLRALGLANLQEHPVVEVLVSSREALTKLDKLEKKLGNIVGLLNEEVDELELDAAEDSEEVEEDVEIEKPVPVTSKKSRTKKPTPKTKKTKPAKSVDVEAISAPSLFVEEEFVAIGKTKDKKRKRDLTDDFMDPTTLDSIDAEDKAARKRSLRHHALRLVAASDRRERMQHSGDVDLPRKVKERRQDKKGVPQPVDGDAELDDEEPESVVRDLDMDDGEDYYAMVQGKLNRKKRVKEEEKEFSAANNLRVKEEVVEAGGKRQINYKILKNKGLTPYRKKEQRNPRVKNKNRYEKKMKKLSSFGRRGTHGQAGEKSGSYGGERTGIRTGVARSVKLE